MPELISEPIIPISGQGDASLMAMGEPGIPACFTWRKVDYQIVTLVRRWKGYGPEGHVAGNEVYVRRHWAEIVTTSGHRMVIYCDRQARNRRKPEQRWWIYSLEAAHEE